MKILKLSLVAAFASMLTACSTSGGFPGEVSIWGLPTAQIYKESTVFYKEFKQTGNGNYFVEASGSSEETTHEGVLDAIKVRASYECKSKGKGKAKIINHSFRTANFLKEYDESNGKYKQLSVKATFSCGK